MKADGVSRGFTPRKNDALRSPRAAELNVSSRQKKKLNVMSKKGSSRYSARSNANSYETGGRFGPV